MYMNTHHCKFLFVSSRTRLFSLCRSKLKSEVPNDWPLELVLWTEGLEVREEDMSMGEVVTQNLSSIYLVI